MMTKKLTMESHNKSAIQKPYSQRKRGCIRGIVKEEWEQVPKQEKERRRLKRYRIIRVEKRSRDACISTKKEEVMK